MFSVIRSRCGSAVLNFLKPFQSPFSMYYVHTSSFLNAEKTSETSPNNILDPKKDTAFKHLFGSERNSEILLNFLNDIMSWTGTPLVKDVTVINPKLGQRNPLEKDTTIDVYCSDETGRRIVLEMQVVKQKGFLQRVQYYVSKAYSQQLLVGDNYAQLGAIIGIAVVEHKLFNNTPEYITKHKIRNVSDNECYINDQYYIFLELGKFEEEVSGDTHPMLKWLYFLKYANQIDSKKMEFIAGKDSIILKAYHELNRCCWMEDDLQLYNLDEFIENNSKTMRDEGRVEGIAEGTKLGIHISQIETARKMVEDGFSTEVISRLTGLEYDVITELRYGRL